ncbi:MAG: Mfa1 fimbrilin C-terminal domain-containing protein [Candidatus Amulumruptor caecigallinarius]|nr:Mfa1 fimbrilin C-terminal domain-containing protein [Candidatus Amulumruptor caecigallinarius]MCM1395985.1 Mfa1 fimbrilin C-terminal domain-containing protein [Candidatus Amulumruptor caecigallinarius]MCM1453017.1 Mfa1 fimbrilin C-terminal domain-containing protein [bacterium]
MRITHHITLASLLALSPLVSGCSAGDASSTEPVAAEASAPEGSMQLRLMLDSAAPGSRAADAPQDASDMTIADVMLLLFTSDVSGEPENLYAVLRADNISEADAAGSRTFDARLGISASTPRHLVAVAVANASRFFDALHVMATQAADYSSVASLLTEDMDGRAAAPQLFTFYGRATTLIDTSLKAQSVKMSMLRDLARVRITLADDVYARGHRLASLHIYNRFDHICLFPLNYAGGRATLPGGVAAAANVVPEPAMTDSPSLTIHVSEQDILMDGSGDPEDEWRFTRPALIAGIYYRGSELSYYRIDLKDTAGKLYDILRNHCYNVCVTSVDGPGQPTPEEAYFNITAGIAADIVPWVDSDFDAAFDGGSWVALARDVTLGPAAGDVASLAFATNVPVDQWELAWGMPGDDPAALTYTSVSPLSGDLFEVTLPQEVEADGHASLNFRALQNIPSDADSRVRTLYINVTPRLRLAVNVCQAQAPSDGSDAPWGADYIFGDL